MHCPSCGNESSLEQKFCRQCGLSLEPVSKLVAEHQTTDNLKLEKIESDQVILRRMYRWMMWGFLAILIGVILLVVVKTFALDKLINLVASLLMLGGVSAATYGLMSTLRDGAVKSKKLPPANAPVGELEKGQTTKELLVERIAIPVPSVTERTTQLIGEERSADSAD